MKFWFPLLVLVFALSPTLQAGEAVRSETTQELSPSAWYADREVNLQLWGTYLFSSQTV